MVISEGAGGNMTTTYKSVVYYHEDKPKWAETVKVIHPWLSRISALVGSQEVVEHTNRLELLIGQ